MKHKLITVFDILIISLVVILCFCGMLFSLGSNSGQKAVVIINDKIVEQISLYSDQSKLIKTDNGYNLIIIKNGECSVQKADCRDEICVKHHSISKKGQSIVCLPHKLIIEIR